MGTSFRSMAISLIAVITMPNIFSCLLSFFGMIYFLSMLKINVIDVKFKKSWELYLKSIWKWLINKNRQNEN